MKSKCRLLYTVLGCFVLENIIQCQHEVCFCFYLHLDQVKEPHSLFLAGLHVPGNEQTRYLIQDFPSEWLRSSRGSSGGKAALRGSWWMHWRISNRLETRSSPGGLERGQAGPHAENVQTKPLL